MTEQPEETQPAPSGNASEEELLEQSSREARDARYDENVRTRLREVEAQRDGLADRLAIMIRAERDRLALERLPEAALSMLPDDIPLTDDSELDT